VQFLFGNQRKKQRINQRKLYTAFKENFEDKLNILLIREEQMNKKANNRHHYSA